MPRQCAGLAVTPIAWAGLLAKPGGVQPPDQSVRSPRDRPSLAGRWRERRIVRQDCCGTAPMNLVATSLELPKDLNSRIARLAERPGASPHAFMLRRLDIEVEAAERFEKSVADARQADHRMGIDKF